MSNTTHPRGLYSLFATEFWERFSYYGMRGFFMLYLTTTLINGGFGLTEEGALIIYGLFTSLVYVTPILGGILADKLLGQRKSIYIGALLMALGQFTMALSVVRGQQESAGMMREFSLYAGLGLLILGNGFFKPNISSMVGGLYGPNDPNKDGGFTIFYMGINLGALVTNFIGGTLAENIGWEWGFITAGIGMVLATIWFFFTETSIQNKETGDSVGLFSSDDSKTKKRLNSADWFSILLYTIGATVIVLAIIYAIINYGDIISTAAMIAGGAGFLYLAFVIFKNTKGKTEWNHVTVILILALFNVVFWSGFEQAGGSFTLFAKKSTDLHVFGYNFPASWFQSVNALFIVLLAPVFTIIWERLTRKHLNPRTPNKFGFSLIFLSLGFVVMGLAHDAADPEGANILVSPLWLIMVYLLHTIGELCMSPIGLSMITKLSPAKIVSVMMGLWMGSIALGNYLAAAMTAISNHYDYPTFYFIAVYAAIFAALAFIVAPVLNRLMKGIH